MEENDDVAAIFLKVRGNVVSVGENIYDLSIPAVKDTMELYPREIDRWECLDRVQRLWHHFNNKDKPE